MSLTTTLFETLRHVLPASLLPHSHRRHFQEPLLDRQAMLDLLYRVETHRTDSEQFRDVAHTRIGDMRSVYRGYGMDFEESRPYLPGDELRFMNWRLTARTGQPYMKVFREERRPGVFIVIDRRSTMRFGSRTRLKATQAVRAAAVAAFSAQLQHIPVGGVILEQEPRWLTEQTGEQAAFRLLQAASTPCPPRPQYQDEPSLQHTLKLLQAILVRGSKLYLVSDFLDLDESARPVLLQLATDHHVYALQIFDALEQQLPSMGKLAFIAPGTNQTVTLDTASTGIQQAYTEVAQDHFQQHSNLFSSLGIQHRLIPTSEEAIEDSVPFA
jgi:uncharacterized protein (DUF58 family)